MKIENQNSLTLAYLGDAVFELYIREYLLEKNISRVQDLQKESIRYVSARKQAEFLKEMLESNYLTDEEKQIVYRARNHKVNHKPKNTDIITYKNATGLEALIGWLYLNKNIDRINEIIKHRKEEEI